MQFLSQVIALINKIVNKLFGRTALFIILLAWFLIITGVIMLFKPHKAKQALASQGFGIFKGYLLVLALFLGALLVSLTNRINGLLALAVLIAGLIILIRAYVRLKKIAAHKINLLVEKVSGRYLTGYCVVQIVVGILMLKFHRRIWF